MAKYRHIHTTFWIDPKVSEEMTPEERYFYLYLLTNPYTTQIGIYPISKKQIAFHMGYSAETINQLMERFEHSYNLIQYNDKTREIAILNWGKYNLNKGGKPVLDCINKELKECKDGALIQSIIPSIESETIRNAFIARVDTIRGRFVNESSTISGQKEKEKEKEIYIDHFAKNEEIAEKKVLQNPVSKEVENQTQEQGEASFLYSAKEKEEELKKEFEEVWTFYPRKVDKKASLLKYKQARKMNEFQEILIGVQNYALECKKENREAKFIKHGKTFFANDCFMDYQEALNTVSRGTSTKGLTPISKQEIEGEDLSWINTKDSTIMKNNSLE